VLPTTVLPISVLIAIVAVSLALPLLGWAVLARPERVQQQVRANLTRRLLPPGAEPVQGTAPARSTLLVAVVRRLTPRSVERRLETLLARAGRPADWPLGRLLAAKLVLPLVVGVLGSVYVRSTGRPLAVLITLVVLVIAYFLPELLLHSRAQERSAKITLALADTLDQMTIAVEAGLGFDSAMARAGRNGRGPLADELVRTLQDIQMGHSRRQAYEALAHRTDVTDLRRFVRAVLQADAYGIAVADVLRTQAAEMRMKRRQRAEEKAMQIPVKVIFPLMLCILPCLFIVLLGPAALDILAAFS
jgi:tight adherence protein C